MSTLEKILDYIQKIAKDSNENEFIIKIAGNPKSPKKENSIINDDIIDYYYYKNYEGTINYIMSKKYRLVKMYCIADNDYYTSFENTYKVFNSY